MEETNHVVMVSIPKKEYDQLNIDSDLLRCLTSAGVDNWDGFEEAIAEMIKIHPGGF